MSTGFIRAIFFDAVGTVIHPDPSPIETYRAVAQRFGSSLSESVIADRFRLAFRREEELDRERGLRTSEAREHERWQRIVASVLDDVNDPAACFAELWDHFSNPSAWRCEPDTAEVLHELADRGLVLGLASNYDRRLRSVVEGLPALRAIRHLVISSEVGWRKPAPAFFEEVKRVAEVTAEQLVLVGDDQQNDIDGARAAGMQSVLFQPNGESDERYAPRIHRLGQLPGLIGSPK